MYFRNQTFIKQLHTIFTSMENKFFFCVLFRVKEGTDIMNMSAKYNEVLENEVTSPLMPRTSF